MQSLLALALVPAIVASLASASPAGDLTLKGKECRIKTDLKAKEGKPVVERVDRYCEHFAAFYDELGLEPKSSNRVIMRLFASRDDFVEFYRRSNRERNPPAAYFSPSLNGIVAYHDANDPYLRQVLFHETSHQYLNRFAYHAPSWIHEGLAEYFEGWQLAPDGALIERRPPFFDLMVLQAALRADEFLHPRELVGMEPKEFKDYRENHPELHRYLHYATAWGLAWYALEGPNAEDRALYVDYLRRLNEDGERAAPFEPEDWDAFEERWKEFVLSLEITPKTADDHFILAANLREEEEYGEAAEGYAKALEMDPERPGVNFWIGYCYAFAGDIERSRVHLKKSLEEDEDDPRPPYMLARISVDVDEDFPQALAYAELANERADEESPVYMAYMARCHHLNGDAKKAIKAMKKVLKLVKGASDEEKAPYEAQLEEYEAG